MDISLYNICTSVPILVAMGGFVRTFFCQLKSVVKFSKIVSMDNSNIAVSTERKKFFLDFSRTFLKRKFNDEIFYNLSIV